jgi:hypothetical protein
MILPLLLATSLHTNFEVEVWGRSNHTRLRISAAQ